jgi:hypothetical protein
LPHRRKTEVWTRAKIRFFPDDNNMDAERINLIGTQLADLSSRTQSLRGYL